MPIELFDDKEEFNSSLLSTLIERIFDEMNFESFKFNFSMMELNSVHLSSLSNFVLKQMLRIMRMIYRIDFILLIPIW